MHSFSGEQDTFTLENMFCEIMQRFSGEHNTFALEKLFYKVIQSLSHGEQHF